MAERKALQELLGCKGPDIVQSIKLLATKPSPPSAFEANGDDLLKELGQILCVEPGEQITEVARALVEKASSANLLTQQIQELRLSIASNPPANLAPVPSIPAAVLPGGEPYKSPVLGDLTPEWALWLYRSKGKEAFIEYFGGRMSLLPAEVLAQIV